MCIHNKTTRYYADLFRGLFPHTVPWEAHLLTET